ncbi:MAG: hypothetical protein M5R42_09725 [Rhodocyclaceae bacterium]|nr:hypothetical protein [Rhodocyclaceae bacterium]
MKIQIVSDIHLSLAPCVIPDVGADLLILAGDIHRPVEALRWAKELPIPIVYVPATTNTTTPVCRRRTACSGTRPRQQRDHARLR